MIDMSTRKKNAEPNPNKSPIGRVFSTSSDHIFAYGFGAMWPFRFSAILQSSSSTDVESSVIVRSIARCVFKGRGRNVGCPHPRAEPYVRHSRIRTL